MDLDSPRELLHKPKRVFGSRLGAAAAPPVRKRKPTLRHNGSTVLEIDFKFENVDRSTNLMMVTLHAVRC